MLKFFTRVFNKNLGDFRLYTAFTLAEVLITLGIIGVVAAMTISTLQTVKEYQYKQSAKEQYSKASQAVKQMLVDDKGILTDLAAVSGAFKPVFMTYFKVARDCNNRDCVNDFQGTSNYYKSLSGQWADGWRFNEGQFVTIDGIFWAIENEDVASGGVNWGNKIYTRVDVNGYSKGPNTYGIDAFIFQIVGDRLLPLGANGTSVANLANSNFCNRGTSSMYQGWTCMSNVVNEIDY